MLLILGTSATPLTTHAQKTPDAAAIGAATTQEACTSAGGEWTPADVSDTGNVGSGSCRPPGSYAAKDYAKQPSTCDSYWSLFDVVCWGRTLSVLIGSALIAMSAWLLAVAALFFNFLVDHTIIQFGALFTPGVREGIDIGWSAIRDIANIVIIGMFVFIAINIILGVKDFGEKKMIARILIVAVLLNFSLLFSKVIIDTSNFVAMQFYKASELYSTSSGAGQNGVEFTGDFSQKGIAGQFIKFAGLEGVGKTYEALKTASFGIREDNYATASGWTALLFGLVTATLFTAAALVLLYGCYILVTRAVLLVFIMLTSALAFASWLIPHHTIDIGWTTWWKSLLKSAFLAPILMGLLWATLVIADAVSVNTKSGTLGSLISNPTQPLNLEALLAYVVILGLLYGSFYAANNLATSISGFGGVSTALRGLAKYGAFAAPGLAWRFGVAPVMRQTAGRAAYGIRESLLSDGKAQRSRAGELRTLALRDEKAGRIEQAEAKRKEASEFEKRAGSYALWAGRAKNIAESGFNIADSDTAKSVAKTIGLSALAAGQRPKGTAAGYMHGIEERIKLGEERSKALDVSPSERRKTEDEARQQTYRERSASEEGQQRRRAYESAKAEHEAEKARAERDEGGQMASARRELMRMQTEAERAKQALRRTTQERILPLQANLSQARTEEERTDILRQIDTHVQEGKTQEAAEDRKVQSAQKTVDYLKKNLTEAEQKLSSATSNLNAFDKETENLANEAGKNKVASKQRGIEGAAEYIGKKSAGVFYTVTGEGKHIAGEVRGKARGRIGTSRLRAALTQLRSENPRAVDEEVDDDH